MLSIIVPVYNVEKYLPRCMDSLLAQTYRDIEIILVDDGSTDGSGALCDAYAAKEECVRVIHQENGGLGAARNTGVSSAQGELIAFVDSDDWVRSDMFEKLINALESNPSADMAKCGYCETDGGGSDKDVLFSGKRGGMQITSDPKNLLRYYRCGAPWVVAWNTVYRRELAVKVQFPPGLYHEDIYASFFYLYYSHGCVIVNEPLYCYWQNPAGITRDSGNQSKRDRDKVTVMERLLAFADTQGEKMTSEAKTVLRSFWAREYFHLIRGDRSLKSLPTQTLRKILENLDLRRSLELRFIALRRGIRTDSDSRQERIS